MTSEPTVAVVAPVFGSAPTLDELVERTLTAAPTARLILVDDACPWGGGAEASRLAAREPRLTVVHHPTNLGQQLAIRTGLQAARGVDVVVVLDADLQDPPEAVPVLVRTLGGGGHDAVFAGRRGRYESIGRLLAGAAHRRLLAATLGLPRDAGGYVAMTERCVDAVLALDGPPQLVAMIGRTGLSTTSVPVRRASRPVGTSTIGGVARLDHAWAGLRHVLLDRSARHDDQESKR